MIFIIAIVGPFSGLKEQVDQNELGKEQQPRRLVLDGSYGIEFPDSHPPRCGCQAATVLALAEAPWRAKANSLGFSSSTYASVSLGSVQLQGRRDCPYSPSVPIDLSKTH
jgi:hypothetical protein